MSKLFLVLALLCAAIALLGMVIMVWNFLIPFELAAKITGTAMIAFFPNIIVYCTLEDRK